MILKKLQIFISCKLFGHHSWTSNHKKGIKPTNDQLAKGVDGFWDYSKMWCDKCGKPSKFNKV